MSNDSCCAERACFAHFIDLDSHAAQLFRVSLLLTAIFNAVVPPPDSRHRQVPNYGRLTVMAAITRLVLCPLTAVGTSYLLLFGRASWAFPHLVGQAVPFTRLSLSLLAGTSKSILGGSVIVQNIALLVVLPVLISALSIPLAVAQEDLVPVDKAALLISILPLATTLLTLMTSHAYPRLVRRVSPILDISVFIGLCINVILFSLLFAPLFCFLNANTIMFFIWLILLQFSFVFYISLWLSSGSVITSWTISSSFSLPNPALVTLICIYVIKTPHSIALAFLSHILGLILLLIHLATLLTCQGAARRQVKQARCVQHAAIAMTTMSRNMLRDCELIDNLSYSI